MKRIFWIILVGALAVGCKKPEWAGRYKSNNCLTLEYVEFYQDNTADIKYYGSKFAANHKLKRDGNHFYVNIYKFELRQDGKMYEESGYDIGCILTKDPNHGFWDKVLEP